MSVFTKTRNACTRIFRDPLTLRVYSTHGDFIKSMHPDIEIPKANMVEYVMKDFGKWHDKIATECAITGKKYTFEQLRSKSVNLGKSFRKVFKLSKGDVVAVFLPNNPDYPICVFGTILGGLTVTTINPTYTVDELERHLKDSNAKAIITFGAYWDTVHKSVNKLTRPIPIVIIKNQANESIPEKAVNYDELLNMKVDLPDMVPIEGDDVIFLPYSSGTTGLPKGVMLTNNNLVTNVAQNRSPAIQYAIETTDTYQDVLPLIIPMYHIYGFTVSTMSLLSTGCKIVTIPKFSPDVYLGTIARCKPTILHLVPPLVAFLNTYPGVKMEYFENLRSILCGAAPLGALDEEKFRKTVGRPFQILQGYGMTETSPATFIVPQCLEGKYSGSIGHPIPNTMVKVVDPEDTANKHLGPHQNGELLIKGPQLMKGYYNRPEETKKSIIDGWFRTGDIVYYNEDKIFFVTDRIKDLIKVKGFQVAPAELEEIIRDFPGVAEVAVIGVPHPSFGESPRAYVVKRDGGDVDVDKLLEYTHSKLSKHKRILGGVAFVDSIPKNASGKILRKEIRAQYLENKM